MRGILAALAALVLATGSAQAMPRIKDGKVVITFDRGGYIDAFVAKWKYIAQKGYKVEVRGPCVSACTLLLGIVPPENVCWADGARFGFHAASVGSWDGKKWVFRVDPTYTVKMDFQFYPRWVARWVADNVPLTNDVVFMGPEVFGSHYRRCPKT